MAKYVALLRGINVGTAKQVPMAALRQVCEGLGWRGVTTVLRSGSVVFDADPAPEATALETELEQVTGVSARVLILSASEFTEVASANSLSAVSTDGSKLFTTFLSEAPGSIEVPDAAGLAPEQLQLGDRAVYQWFPEGSTRSTVPRAFWSQFRGVVTARNANTIARILTLLSEDGE